MNIERFEDMESWKKARTLMNETYDATAAPAFAKEWDLLRQLRRSSISIMANIAEGFDADATKEFIRFLKISRRSAGELQSHCYAALDRKLIVAEQFSRLYGLAKEVKRLIGGMIRYLRQVSASPAAGADAGSRSPTKRGSPNLKPVTSNLKP